MDKDQALARRFRNLWKKNRVGSKGKFLGVQTLQNPLDVWIIQEIVSEVKPDMILECGSFHGGSALVWAWLLEMVHQARVGKGRVLSVDVESRLRPKLRYLEIVKRRIEFIKGDSIDPKIVETISAKVRNKKLLVILDSDHKKEHVLQELRTYAPMVPVGSYVVVQNALGGPNTAVEEFLKEDARFEGDASRERYLLTNSPGAFLKRVRE